MAKEYIESKCGSCVHLEACAAWISHGSTLYRDFTYSVADCPYYQNAADVVEVVRCKDCKHYDKHGYKICALHSEQPDQFGAGVNIYMESDDFCSYGERRGDSA